MYFKNRNVIIPHIHFCNLLFPTYNMSWTCFPPFHIDLSHFFKMSICFIYTCPVFNVPLLMDF